MPLTVGGGVRKVEDIRKLLFRADKVSINSAAIYEPQLIKDASNRFGKQCIVIAIDAKKLVKVPVKVVMKYFRMAVQKRQLRCSRLANNVLIWSR